MKVEKISNNRARYTFEVSVDEFKHGLDYAFDQVKEKVEIKGFRKGHVPRNIYESKFGVESLYEDALNHVLHHKFQEAVKHDEFEIVGDPKVNVDIEKVTVANPFEVSFEAPIKPEVDLGDYKGLEVEEEILEVTAEEIDAEIEKKLQQNASLEPKVGALELGDTAIFDFEGFVDGVAFEGGKAENHELEIGSNQFIPGFEEGMIGLNIGQSRDVNVVFPENYHAENLKGKNAVFKVVLHDIKSKVSPKLDDEWVKSLEGGFETVEAYKQSISKQLLEDKKQDFKNKVLETLLEKIAAASKVDIPEEMIDFEVNQNKKNIENQAKQYGIDYDMYLQLSGMDKITFEDQLKVEAQKRVLNSLLIEAIAKKENIQVESDDVEKRFEELSKQYNMPVEEIKKHISEETVKQDLAFSKSLDLIFDSRLQK